MPSSEGRTAGEAATPAAAQECHLGGRASMLGEGRGYTARLLPRTMPCLAFQGAHLGDSAGGRCRGRRGRAR